MTKQRLLIIDTAQRRGQVALALDERIVGSRLLEESRRHARDLVPMVRALLGEQGWTPRELTGVLVSRGPGSYTGLRVGLMSAKTLAYATGCVLMGIDTFAAIARQAPAGTINVLADAQQGKIYVQRFVQGQGGPLEIWPFNNWSESLSPGTWVSGPGLDIFADKLPPHIQALPSENWLPRPESLLAIGLERLTRGESDDPFTLEPLYLRPSAAEEKRKK